MVVSIGAVASASQGVFYYERDGYYARDDPAHREASSWTGRGAEKLGLEGPVDPDDRGWLLNRGIHRMLMIDARGKRNPTCEKDWASRHRDGERACVVR